MSTISIIVLATLAVCSQVALAWRFGHGGGDDFGGAHDWLFGNNNNNNKWDKWGHHGKWGNSWGNNGGGNGGFGAGRNDAQCQQFSKDCKAQSLLATRLTATVAGGRTMTLVQDLIANYDRNADGCISRDEFIGVTTLRGFGVQFASYRYQYVVTKGMGTDNTVCPGAISIAALRKQPLPGVINAVTINNENMKSLIAFCDIIPQRYQTNCDCIQIPDTCNQAPFSTNQACTDFKTAKASRTYCPFQAATATTNDQIKTRCTQRNFANSPDRDLLNALCNAIIRLGYF